MNTQEASIQLLAEAAQDLNPMTSPLHNGSDRSSSLSDIDDNNESEAEVEIGLTAELSPSQTLEDDDDDEEEAEVENDEEGDEEEEEQEQEQDDTEAETERLDESPDKLRKQKKLLLSADNEVSNTNVTPSKRGSTLVREDKDIDEDKTALYTETPILTSPVVSPDDSANEGSSPASLPSLPSKKRKRGQEINLGAKRSTRKSQINATGTTTAITKVIPTDSETKGLAAKLRTDADDSPEESAVNSPIDNGIEELDDAPDVENEAEQSNDEMDMDETVPEADITTLNKSEEDLTTRKEAAEKIINIEKQFAIFRDRMYGEAVANINAELASLDKDEPTHPEYLAVSAAIARQKTMRVALAREKFALQVKNWQKRGSAEQAQSHSQYAQSCRDIRDAALTRASDEWYHIQKGRRAAEDSTTMISLSAYKRTDLVAQQTAYSTEVSILSGIAKYVGFPAAPELPVATAAEIEEDLRSLDTTMPVQQSQVSSSISQYLRQNLAAEKQFSKMTPWANAQHHVHGLHTWSPARPNSPFTPATQSQQGDPPAVIGSASTIIGSHAPTPLSAEVAGSNSKFKTQPGISSETPSRIIQNDRMQASTNTSNNVYAGSRNKIQGPPSLADGPPDGRILHEFSSPAGLPHELKMGMA